jgi:plastocyanin
MRTLTVAVALALTAMTAACGGDEPEPAAEPAASAPASEPAAAPTAQTSQEAPSGEAQALTGTVGTEGDPDAFEITLTDASGQEVTELPAGDYTITVNDLSEIHNFHLTGGEVDETTTVPETGEQTFTVNLTAGEYEAICDPHPRMVTNFTVT